MRGNLSGQHSLPGSEESSAIQHCIRGHINIGFLYISKLMVSIMWNIIILEFQLQTFFTPHATLAITNAACSQTSDT